MVFVEKFKLIAMKIKKFLVNPLSGGQLFLTLTLMNEIMGAGMTALPYAIEKVGVIVGIIILIVSTILSEFNIHILIQVSSRTKSTSYYEMTKISCGKVVALLLMICHILIPFICVVAYGMIIAHNISSACLYFLPNAQVFHNESNVCVLVMCTIVLMLTILQDRTEFAMISNMAIMFVLGSVIIAIYQGSSIPQKRILHSSAWKNNLNYIPTSLNISAFAMACHHNILPIYTSMKKPSIKDFMESVRVAILICLAIYIVFALTGLISFGIDIDPNFFEKYCIKDTLSATMKIFSATSIALTSITQIISIKQSLIQIKIFPKSMQRTSAQLFLICIITAVSSLASIFMNEIESLIDFLCALFLTPCIYIIHPMSYLSFNQGKKSKSVIRKICYVSILFGMVIMISAIVLTVIKLIKPTEIDQDQIKYWCDLDEVSSYQH